MHTYIKKGDIFAKNGKEKITFEVGYYILEATELPDGEPAAAASVWQVVAKFDDEKFAALYVNFLNGGNNMIQRFPELDIVLGKKL